MAFENAEVKIIDTERVLVTDPELYKKRALDALERHYFQDAMSEAEKAIQYGRNERKYQIVKARVLLAREEYNSFLAYILKETQLWEYKDISFELSNDEKDFLLYGFSVCYGQLGYPPDKLPEIILTADGRGMCKSIQEAVDKYSEKTIILTGGWYNENVDIDGKTVRIIGRYYSKPKVNGRWKINNSFCTIKNLLFHNQSDRAGNMLEIDCSEFIVSELSFNSLIEPNGIKENPNAKENHQDLVGLNIKKSIAKDSVKNMIFSNLTYGINSSDTELSIERSDFSSCTIGVLGYNTIKRSLITISNCTFKKNCFGSYATRDGSLIIQHSVFENNDFALGLSYVDDVAGKIKVIN